MICGVVVARVIDLLLFIFFQFVLFSCCLLFPVALFCYCCCFLCTFVLLCYYCNCFHCLFVCLFGWLVVFFSVVFVCCCWYFLLCFAALIGNSLFTFSRMHFLIVIVLCQDLHLAPGLVSGVELSMAANYMYGLSPL